MKRRSKRGSRRAAARYAELSRRKRRRRPPPAPQPQPSQAAAIPRRREPEVAPARISRSYEYVRPELKRIGITAGILISLILIAAIVLGRIP